MVSESALNVRYSHSGNRCRVLVRCVSFSRSVNVSSNKVSVLVVLVKKHVRGICFRHMSCPVCQKLVALISSKSS